jgi:hypothetical protein
MSLNEHTATCARVRVCARVSVHPVGSLKFLSLVILARRPSVSREISAIAARCAERFECRGTTRDVSENRDFRILRGKWWKSP